MIRLVAMLIALASCCSNEQLSVFTEYVSIESLPSYRIGTPDPRLYCPDYGQKLHISWSVPKSCHYHTLELSLKLRFGNKEEQNELIPLESVTGIYVFSLLNEEYRKKGGIFTYKVELRGDGQVLKVWEHQLWAERIQFHQE